jgi:peptidyl-prolyl cis-trans isomerase D
LRVVKIEPPVTQTFEQTRPKIEAELAHEEAVDRIYKVANKVDDALAGGATISDAAEKFGLKTTVVAAADLSGHDPEGKPVALPLTSDDVWKLAFATNEGRTSRVTETSDGAIFVLRIDKIIPSEIKPLAEVREKAIAAWQADKRREAVTKESADLAAAVKPDTRLAALAAEKGLKVATSPPFTRQPGHDDAVPQALVAKLFAAKPGEAVTATDPIGAYVAQLNEVQMPESISQTATSVLSHELDTGMRAALGEEFTQSLRARFPVDIHREPLDRLF